MGRMHWTRNARWYCMRRWRFHQAARRIHDIGGACASGRVLSVQAGLKMNARYHLDAAFAGRVKSPFDLPHARSKGQGAGSLAITAMARPYTQRFW